MSKAILISIKPKWVAKILNGEKTLEIRKTCPEIFKRLKPYEGCDIDVYIYVTNSRKHYLVNRYVGVDNTGLQDYPYGYETVSKKPVWSYNGKVVAKFTLNMVEKIKYHFGYYDMGEWTESYILEKSCLTSEELDNYFKASREYDGNKASKVYGYGWNIENLEIFNKPKSLSQFLIPSHKVQGIDKDGSDKTFTILKPLDRAPQSWCFVEL